VVIDSISRIKCSSVECPRVTAYPDHNANERRSTVMTGIHAFLEVLAAAGVKHLFGNPGTTELPLNDALVNDRRFQYIFGLHEIPVVAMADGYAMA
jgi:hypothetical protein